MDRNRLFKPVVYVMFAMVVMNTLMHKFHWDYSIWWFDTLMHFGGGLWQGLFFIWYFSLVRMPFLRRPVENLKLPTHISALIFVVFIGICWEAGEFLTYNYIGQEPWIALDVFSDLFFDLAGGAFALVYVLYKTMRPELYKVQSS